MFPPEIVRPEAEESPPMVETEIPPAKVEVAVEEALRFPNKVVRPVTCRVEEAAKLPPTLREETAVEEALETNPLLNLQDKLLEAVEEAM